MSSLCPSLSLSTPPETRNHKPPAMSSLSPSLSLSTPPETRNHKPPTMSSLSRSLSLPLELEIQTSQIILVAESPLEDAIANLSFTTTVVAPSDVHKSNLKHLIDHFSHKHPLVLYEEGSNGGGVRCRVGVQKDIICSICRYSISENGPIYSCSSSTSSTECEFFIIHKSCAELPDAIRSVYHPQHILFLRKTVGGYNCVICNNMAEDAGFAYKCVAFGCQVSLHINCALKYNMQDPQGHDHSFILLKPALFTCDACGFEKKDECVSYVCTTCQLQVHQECFSSYSPFPLTVKPIRHPHELSLTLLSQSCYCFLDYDNNNNHNNTCMLCGRGMNDVLCFYYCGDCRFKAHVSCALLVGLRDEYDDEDAFKELENENQDRNPTITTKEISHVGQKATELRHFSHPQHCLILSNDPKLNEFCDGCAIPISVPYYTCVDHPECDFLLHKQCFELPHKIRHPYHNHQLTLQAKAEDLGIWNPLGIFQCEWCRDMRTGSRMANNRFMCNGFIYTCDKCGVFIDVGCSLLRNHLVHDGHDCSLTLVGSMIKTQCNACGLDCFLYFACKKCDFNVDCRCASLPNTISHDCPKPEWGTRPYNLTTYSVDDGSGEYYCDICEEPRDPNHWFYYCKNCHYSAHPQCLLAEHRIKFGKTYLSKCHPHSLTLVKGAKDKGMGHPPCATCGDPCLDVAVLFCTECEIYIHYEKECCDSGLINL